MAKKASKTRQFTATFRGFEAPAPPRELPPHARPLFLPKLIADAARSVQVDVSRRDAAHEVVRKWAGDLRAGVIGAQNEVQVEQDFYKDLLGALGYVTSGGVATGQPWSLQTKWHVPGGGTADAALGRFVADESGHLSGTPVVLIEVERAGKDLDRREPGSGRSPVQQVWDYLSAADESARWAIVSNYDEVRLYSRDRSRNYLHRAFLSDLDHPDAFAEFFAVFRAEGLLGTGAVVQNATWLLNETATRQEAVSDELYQFYAEHRLTLVRELQVARGVALDTAIETAQRLLDRVLFIAFAEDRQLLPDRNTLATTADLKVPALSPWNVFQLLFRAIDRGDERLGIPRYNGNLFKADPILDDPAFELNGATNWPNVFQTIGTFDFKDEVTVDVLGRIFERSIQDIEKLKAEGLEPHAAELDRRRRAPSRRKTQGVYYTDAAIVDYLIDAALRPALDAHRAALAERFDFPLRPAEADGTAAAVARIIPDPPPAEFTRELLARLDGLTVCDPACGSGAFLNAAYRWFEDHRLALLDDLKLAEPDAPECAGSREDWRARSAPSILANNLYGVDISAESVEIAQLSLWIATARRGQPLTDLSANVRRGNSVVADPAVDPLAFDWRARFPKVFDRDRGGFDAVVGNPPYVRQERLGPIKPHLQAHYHAYHGMADLYVYFYERGLDLLRPGGRLAFVVTNKWLKAGYGEPLRRLLAAHSWVESVVDFGHARQFFKDADVFPCFLVARKPNDEPRPETARVCVIPRELASLDSLKLRVDLSQFLVKSERFSGQPWQLEADQETALYRKIQTVETTIEQTINDKPYYGVKTGFNDAFFIDGDTRARLIAADPRSSDLIKPFLRGQDIKRWEPDWSGQWLIFTRRGVDLEGYPALKDHLSSFRARLEPRPVDWEGDWAGRKAGNYAWYEIQDPVEYFELFEKPKIVLQRIAFHSRFALDCTFRKLTVVQGLPA